MTATCSFNYPMDRRRRRRNRRTDGRQSATFGERPRSWPLVTLHWRRSDRWSVRRSSSPVRRPIPNEKRENNPIIFNIETNHSASNHVLVLESRQWSRWQRLPGGVTRGARGRWAATQLTNLTILKNGTGRWSSRWLDPCRRRSKAATERWTIAVPMRSDNLKWGAILTMLANFIQSMLIYLLDM